MVLLTQAGFAVGTAIVADGIPVALQLAAVLVATSRMRRRIPLAAVLCVLALFSKQSALWAPAAICVWLYMRDRRAMWDFAAVFVSGVGVLFPGFPEGSRSRLRCTFLGRFSGGGSRGMGALRPRARLRA